MGKIIGAIIGIAVSIWAVISAWTMWVVPVVPQGPYHGLILVGLAIVCFFFGGGLVVLFTAGVTALFAITADFLTGGK